MFPIGEGSRHLKFVLVTLKDCSTSRAIKDESNRWRMTKGGSCGIGKHNAWVYIAGYHCAREASPIHDLDTI